MNNLLAVILFITYFLISVFIINITLHISGFSHSHITLPILNMCPQNTFEHGSECLSRDEYSRAKTEDLVGTLVKIFGGIIIAFIGTKHTLKLKIKKQP